MPVRLLLVEDDPRAQRALGRLFKREGYETFCADTASAAFELIANQPVEIIILDWFLPDEDGLSVLKKIRADGVKCPVLVLTANPDASSPVEALDAGADDFVTKLGNPEELLARVRALLRRASGY